MLIKLKLCTTIKSRNVPVNVAHHIISERHLKSAKLFKVKVIFQKQILQDATGRPFMTVCIPW